MIGVVYLPHLFSWNKIRTVAAAATIIEDFFPKTKKEFFSAECAKKNIFEIFGIFLDVALLRRFSYIENLRVCKNKKKENFREKFIE